MRHQQVVILLLAWVLAVLPLALAQEVEAVREIAVGEKVEITSTARTDFALALAPYEAVQVSMETDFPAWLYLLAPDGETLYRSGHANSGSTTGSVHYVATADGERLTLRVTAARAGATNGTFSLQVEPLTVRVLEPDTPTRLEHEERASILAVNVIDGKRYRLAVEADEAISLTIDNVISTAAVDLPFIRMDKLLGTARVWEADATGRAHISVGYAPEDAVVTVQLEALE